MQLTFNSIDKFIGINSFVVDGEYFSKKDIIEYVGYVLGTIHYNTKPEKYKKIEKIKNLSFDIATGGEKRDALVFFAPVFSSEEAKQKFTPHLCLELGNKHEGYAQR